VLREPQQRNEFHYGEVPQPIGCLSRGSILTPAGL